ncbi:hypothetical protein ACWELJ_09000 [Nocardia sp. NPDC004582]
MRPRAAPTNARIRREIVMQDGAMNTPHPQSPIVDVYALLNGAFDLRLYSRRYLVLSTKAPLQQKFFSTMADFDQAFFGPIVAMTDAIEWLERQGWSLVSMLDRDKEQNNFAYTLAFMRRDQP